MEFYKHVHYCFCCYAIEPAGEAANKVLSVVWNPLLIEINLSQIRTLDIKREKVCAVCPYLLLYMESAIGNAYFLSHEICLFRCKTDTRDTWKGVAKFHAVLMHVLRLVVTTFNICDVLLLWGVKKLKMHLWPFVPFKNTQLTDLCHLYSFDLKGLKHSVYCKNLIAL